MYNASVGTGMIMQTLEDGLGVLWGVCVTWSTFDSRVSMHFALWVYNIQPHLTIDC